MGNLAEILAAEIEAAADAMGIAPSTVGKLAGQGGNFYKRLKSGKRVWPETAASVRAAIQKMQQQQQSRGREQ